jgi:hypothetical protein
MTSCWSPTLPTSRWLCEQTWMPTLLTDIQGTFAKCLHLPRLADCSLFLNHTQFWRAPNANGTGDTGNPAPEQPGHSK